MTIETLSDTTGPFGAVVRTYRAYRLDMEGRTSGPPLLFEARDDAAALLRARASMSDDRSVRRVAIRDGGAAFGFSPIALIAKCMLKQKAPDDAGAQVRQRSGDQ